MNIIEDALKGRVLRPDLRVCREVFVKQGEPNGCPVACCGMSFAYIAHHDGQLPTDESNSGGYDVPEAILDWATSTYDIDDNAFCLGFDGREMESYIQSENDKADYEMGRKAWEVLNAQ